MSKDGLFDMAWSDETKPRVRPFAELRSSGLLWLINRVVFHPRGYALALVVKDGEPIGWRLQGDGSEVWQFSGDEDELFRLVGRTLRGEGEEQT